MVRPDSVPLNDDIARMVPLYHSLGTVRDTIVVSVVSVQYSAVVSKINSVLICGIQNKKILLCLK